MTIGKTIPKPTNWQDFETLCRKLFGEMWQCEKTIKKNGRNGQAQHGVDVYGIPKGESTYWGVQCKGKDDYTKATLSETEIDEEIKKSKKFKPALGFLFFATTANKDAKTEEYVRKKNLESRHAGSFPIELYCWEDLADRIEEHKGTFNWWVREKRHKQLFDISILFDNEKNEITITPKYRRKIQRYVFNEAERRGAERMSRMTARMVKLTKPVGVSVPHVNSLSHYQALDQHNLGRCRVDIVVENTGQEVIEDYRIDFLIDGDIESIDDGESLSFLGPLFKADDGSISYRPKENAPLTQSDSRFITFYVLPKVECKEISVRWKLYARDYPAEGILSVHIEPTYDDDVELHYVDSPARHQRVPWASGHQIDVEVRTFDAGPQAQSRFGAG